MTHNRLFIVLLIFLFFSCKKNETQKFCSVSGYVYYQNRPISNVQVSLDNKYNYSTNTNSDGYFEIQDVNSGNHVLSLKKLITEFNLYSEKTYNITVNGNLKLNVLKLSKVVILYDAIQITCCSARIAWGQTDDSEFKEYRLYRNNNSNINDTLGTLVYTSTSLSDTSFEDNSIDPQSTYFYILYVKDSNGTIGKSNTIFLTTPVENMKWVSLYSKKNTVFTSVFFTNINTGYVTGFYPADISDSRRGILMKTTNGGQSWETLIDQSGALRSVTFLDNTGYIIGDKGTFLKSTNGGNTWVPMPTGIPSDFKSIYFINKNKGFVCSDTTTLMTNDGAKTWITLSFKNPESRPQVFYFLDTLNGFAVACKTSEIYDDQIFNTTDGGLSWQFQGQIYIAYRPLIYDIWFTDKNTGIAIGNVLDEGAPGIACKTSNGGKDWIINYITGFQSVSLLHSIYFRTHNTGFIAGCKQILKTSDGGSSWSQSYEDNNNDILDIFFVGHTGFAVGEGGTILKTVY